VGDALGVQQRVQAGGMEGALAGLAQDRVAGLGLQFGHEVSAGFADDEHTT
jgi:hypothetical protein